jgi:hypothetical protein
MTADICKSNTVRSETAKLGGLLIEQCSEFSVFTASFEKALDIENCLSLSPAQNDKQAANCQSKPSDRISAKDF